ncbi:hypothetical protein EPO17_01675 [Patescibacteria group bacterium]|nr:MAG: hypothetical protein EPO17_01675 [Patescibacteria group bacterium]
MASKNSTDDGAIKIGVAIPLTGNYGSIGEKIKNGLDLAKQDIESKNPGVSIKLVYEDACLPKDITSAVQKLINVDEVRVINQFCAIGLVPSIDITESKKVISVGVAANVSDLTSKKYYFSPNFSVKENATTIANFGTNTLKAKKAAFLYYNTQFGKDYRRYTGEQFVASGGEIVADEMVNLDITDFRTNLAKIKKAKPDIIFVTHLTGGLGTIIKQAKELGMKTPFVGNYQNEDSLVLNIAGSAAEGFIISSADPEILSANNSEFKQAYQNKHDVAPDVFASNAYDALRLEVPAYIACKGDTDCIAQELHKVANYKGVSGTITIDQNGFASKPTVFKIVKDGKFVLYK